MSKPSSAICGTTRRTPSKPPHERGNNSYHELKRARSRSTLTTAGSGSVPAALRSGQCSAAAARAGGGAARAAVGAVRGARGRVGGERGLQALGLLGRRVAGAGGGRFEERRVLAL